MHARDRSTVHAVSESIRKKTGAMHVLARTTCSVRQRACGTFGQVYDRKNTRSATQSGMLQHDTGTHLDEDRC